MSHRLSPRPALLLVVAALLAACGGATDETASDNTSQIAADGRKSALAVTTRLAVPLTAPADPSMAGLAIPADAATRGMWGPVQSWPMIPIHGALLPDGRVLTYGTPQTPAGQTPNEAQDGRTFSVWTPSLGFGTNAHAVSFEAGRVDSFCSTADWLGDGRLLVTGGNTPRSSTLFVPSTRATTTDGARLADDRWYATMLTMPDGRLVMLGGIDPYTEPQNLFTPDAALAAGQVSMTPEIYTPGSGWRSLMGATNRLAFGPDNLRASYPRAWVAPNGEIFGISADQMWWLDVSGNAGNGVVRSAGTFKGAPSAANPLNVGATNSAVMFAPGRILQVGGNGGFNGDGLPASNMATVVDINGAAPVVTETARMGAARRFPSATVMPNGQVLVTGGTRFGNNGGGDAVFAAENWNPATGTWTTMASANRIRVYHSGAMLLPNGTVMALGGGAPGPQQNTNAELYYPPYLFRSTGAGSVLATRPVMTGINARTHRAGGAMQVEMRDSTRISRLVLVRGSNVTHAFNNGQRFVELQFTQTGDFLDATLPASANTIPPGVWQLFALDAAGVPSQATIITIQPGASVLPRDVPLALGASRVANAAMAVDAGNLGVLGTLPGLPTTAQASASRFIVRAGLADAACVSLEHAAQPGQFLRHQFFRALLSPNDGSALFRDDATFCPEPGLAGHSLTLRSRNLPGHVLRERDGQLWLDPQAADTQFRNSATWAVRTLPVDNATPLPALPALPAAPVAVGAAAVRYTPGLDATGLSFSWSFGDGSPDTPFSSTSATTKTWATPGVFTVSLTVRNQAGQISISRFVQAVHAPVTASAARSSTAMLVEPRTGAAARLWVVNPDQDNVAVFDATTMARAAIVAVGAAPRSIARAPDGSLWVVNSNSASISVISPTTLAVTRTIALPRASQPQGLVFAPNGSAAWVTLGAVERLLSLDPATGAQLGAWATGPEPRGLAISGDSSRLLVSRFVTAPLPGEGTATVTTTGNVGGEVWSYNTASMATPPATVWLRHSDRTDNEVQGSGVPNYLGAPAISPDGRSAWVPSKQDNIRRGTLRNGQNLDFQNTVRAISSLVDLSAATPVELPARRIDHDNASLAAAAVYDPTGAYLFVALETSRQVAVLDAVRGGELLRVETQLAPQALAVSADGRTLYVQNFMSRSVSRVDLTPLMTQGRLALPGITAASTIVTDRLAAGVLRGKQLFYDARDPRLSRDSYMSCASCHSDGGQDGRTWDLTGFGEGLRNTVTLKGRAGMGHGLLHWSGNFDEVQDFEAQIRTLAGGTGLMADATYFAGTRSQPLGDRKTGLSADLDALAAYVGSLGAVEASPWRNADSSLTAAALAGQAAFERNNCATCHTGTNFSSSSLAGGMRGVGTLRPGSGNRLGAPLTGIDVPTLRGVWATAPYLHNGSAATLEAAVTAHAPVPAADLANIAAYLRSIEALDAAPVRPVPNGVYRLVAQHSGQTLNIGGISLTAGAAAIQWPWLAGDNERWRLTRQADGSVTLAAQHSGQLLEVAGCSAAAGALVQQGPANGAPCQRWRLQPVADGSFNVVNVASGQVLNIGGASQAAGAGAIQWPLSNASNERWRLEPVSPNGIAVGTYALAASHSAKVLDVAGISAAPGTNVQQWINIGGLNQRWTVRPTADGYFDLAPAHAPSMRLEVAAGGTAFGSNVQQGLASGSAAQRWSFERQPDGSWRLINANSGLSLDVAGAAQADGGNVHQWEWINVANQRWTLTVAP